MSLLTISVGIFAPKLIIYRISNFYRLLKRVIRTKTNDCTHNSDTDSIFTNGFLIVNISVLRNAVYAISSVFMLGHNSKICFSIVQFVTVNVVNEKSNRFPHDKSMKTYGTICARLSTRSIATSTLAPLKSSKMNILRINPTIKKLTLANYGQKVFTIFNNGLSFLFVVFRYVSRITIFVPVTIVYRTVSAAMIFLSTALKSTRTHNLMVAQMSEKVYA